MGKQTEFVGVLLGWDESDYFVHPLDKREVAAYDTSNHAPDVYDVQRTVRVPHNFLGDAGSPERSIRHGIPFGFYAALTLPNAFHRINVMIGDGVMDIMQQKELVPDFIFQKDPSGVSNLACYIAGLALSAVSLSVDGVR